ncbi:MAG TPA: cytochrome c oxidase assembly protein [Luteitalea sp.]|nr:cytochrome c oxidase assembly protein [Luteitalea sp.]
MTPSVDAITAVVLAAAAVSYALGVRAAWQRSGTGRVLTPWQVAAAALGLATLAVSLVSPVATLALARFSVHMTQHELLMLVAAPLLVMGRPLLAWLWAVPPPRRAAIVRACHTGWVTRGWAWLTAPLVVFLLHGLACGSGTCQSCSRRRCTTNGCMRVSTSRSP